VRAQTIGLVAHPDKAGVDELARNVSREFQSYSREVLIENETAALARAPAGGTIAEVAQRSDLIVVLGGDGTILNVVASAGEQLKPIFGINVGSLGFLTCVNSSAWPEAVEAIATGRVSYSQRVLLSVQLKRSDRVDSALFALNDAVISRGNISRLIRLQTRIDDEPLTEFNADGLIIATPTGSTAYSLSAGGPILTPESGVFVITPICPHVLTNRSLIVNDSVAITVTAATSEYPTFLSLDGREPMPVPGTAEIRIERAKSRLQLGFLPEVTFFSVLRQKLKWTGSNI
jgi:NAD+ kinase